MLVYICKKIAYSLFVSKIGYFDNYNPNILFIVETKLYENYATYFFLQPNYEAIRKDKNVRGDGVLIAVLDKVVAEPLQNAYILHLTIDLQTSTSNPLKLAMNLQLNYTDHQKTSP